MTRLYARGPGGRRIHETTPGGHWKIMTILGAMSLSGMVATMTIEEPTDTDISLAYVEHLLCPILKAGGTFHGVLFHGAVDRLRIAAVRVE
jgi:hypothetical protein